MTAESPPRIGLIVPNYWDGDMIRATLLSVREQESVDVVVVDDATPDDTVLEKLRGYEAEGLISRLILLEDNVGASRAINIGASASDARYICTFANDDLLLPGALGALADALDADPEARFAVGDFEYFGARVGLRKSLPWDPWRALGRNAWPGSMLIHRDTFLELGGLTDECNAQDWDLYLNLAKHDYRGVVISRTIYEYRIHEHGGRLSTIARKAYRDEARAVRRRHPELFARERELRRTSRAGLVEKLFWTLMIRIAPYRPPFLTNMFFHTARVLAGIKSLFSRSATPTA